MKQQKSIWTSLSDWMWFALWGLLIIAIAMHQEAFESIGQWILVICVCLIGWRMETIND